MCVASQAVILQSGWFDISALLPRRAPLLFLSFMEFIVAEMLRLKCFVNIEVRFQLGLQKRFDR